MFVRRKSNKSGSISVQLVEKRGRRNVVVQSFGSSREEAELQRLEAAAQTARAKHERQLQFAFHCSEREQAVVELIKGAAVRSVGPELVLGKIFDEIGFGALKDELFRDIVLARLVYPTSKLGTANYLLHHQGKDIGVTRLYRFLDRLRSRYQEQVEQIAYHYSKRILGDRIAYVFYDMTTLYFEAESEDDLRKIGFSKDGKFQHPQIMLGLLVGPDGYPISYDIFEGNTFEGKTLLPVLQRAKKRFGFVQPTVIADSGLLSADNIALLCEQGYNFILGARIKNESSAMQKQILEASCKLKDQDAVVFQKDNGHRLIIDYSLKRAAKDASNREKGIKRLQARISSGRLTKNTLNNRGYNKFLTMTGEVKVALDETKVIEDKQWDGLKGYLTNSSLSPETVIAHYRQLWKIERAFRISKTDLRIRPIYHRKKARIEAHICIAFVAYTILKELERRLAQAKFDLSPQKAIELLKSIYQIEVLLPDSNRISAVLTNLTPLKSALLNL